MSRSQILCTSLCLLNILQSSLAVDILSSNQTLADGDVLISPGQMFELGFFSPGKSTARFLGIWYKATPDVVVWVANRESPIISSKGILTLAENGTLILSSAQSSNVWSSGSSMAASGAVLQLLDTGNLVVVDNSSNTWQSFDYAGDTRLPGMKMVETQVMTSWKSPNDPSAGDFIFRIENHGLSQLSIFRGSEKRYRNGPWNGLHFSGLPLVRDSEAETVFINGRLVSHSYPYRDSFVMRLTMNYTGVIQRYMMNEERDGWNLVFSLPSDTCDNYGWCGPNSICKPYRAPVCDCLRGFMPKSEREWNELTWTSGCTRSTRLDCLKGDGFLKVERIKSPDTLNFRLETSMTSDECRKECLNNCSCTAYAAPHLVNQRNGCLMWFGDLIDVKEFIGEVTIGPSIYIRVPISELDSSKRKGPAKSVFVAAGASLGTLFLGLSIGGVILRTRRKKQAWKKKSEELDLPLFSLATIAAATNNFSEENILGEGGFGPVYKGSLSADHLIAVKRMSRTSGQGHEEFKNEIILIAKLQHKNLVRILGCCIEGEEMMLIYEYMQNKSLDYFIFDQDSSALLSWPKRFDIIKGIASGLLYLHHDSRLKVIHRDLKTSNILLDENLNAKISDFGLARIFQGDQISARTKRVVGTYGYMAPEYAFDGKFSVKSDVFSLGVVMLEMVSGKKNRGFKHHSCYHNLLEQAWLLWKENRELELMDPCYNNTYVESQVKRCVQVGLLCVQSVVDDRPTMPCVFLMLSSEESVLPQPKKPGFFLHRSPQRTESGGCITMTMSEVEAR